LRNRKRPVCEAAGGVLIGGKGFLDAAPPNRCISICLIRVSLSQARQFSANAFLKFLDGLLDFVECRFVQLPFGLQRIQRSEGKRRSTQGSLQLDYCQPGQWLEVRGSAERLGQSAGDLPYPMHQNALGAARGFCRRHIRPSVAIPEQLVQP
jgi:hypothetical protein